jgi:Fe-S-cluster-containing hydrogenase component 2/bacterioferritin-associated ferredoxin
MKYIPSLCGWVPWHDETMRTSRADLYVAGDTSGIEEASAAMVAGKIAGCSAAAALTGMEVSSQLEGFNGQLAALREGPFGAKIWQGKAELVGRTYDNGKLEPIEEPTPANVAFESGRRVVIECYQRIPCNPCSESCHKHAIKIDGSMSNLPVYQATDCDGCKLCIVRCPGLAMFYVDMDYSATAAEVSIAYEMLPVPAKGETWWALDRDGQFVCEASITKVVSTKSFDKKHLVSFAVPKEFAARARHITPVGKVRKLVKLPPRDVSEDPVICRCEDVRLGQIERAIDSGYHSFEELKRVLRIGMGPCQGKTCQSLVLRILSGKLHKPIGQFERMKLRSPLRPITLGAMSQASTEGR